MEYPLFLVAGCSIGSLSSLLGSFSRLLLYLGEFPSVASCPAFRCFGSVMPLSESESEEEDEQLTGSGSVAPLAVEETGERQNPAGQSRGEGEQGRGSSEEDPGPPPLHPRAHSEEQRREQRELRGLWGRKGS
uniref:Uncharacterized protein n=1 Tax=Micrurus surinamensis TaxID=129470 RepID=A0A2D4PW20_MICSU